MMTETVPGGATQQRRPAPSARHRVRAALAAEWIKLRSLRSLPATLVFTAVFCVGIANLVCSNYVANWPTFGAARKAAFNPLDTNLGFVVLGVLFFGTLGALVVTNEYGNGLIRATFAATPQRGLVLAAKTALLALVALLGSTAICLAAFLSGQGVLAGHVPHVTLADPGVLGHLLGAICYLTAAGLLGLFAGAIARSTAVAISGVFGVHLVLPIMVNSLPHTAVWRHTVPYLPSNLGNALWHSHGSALPNTTVAALGLAAYVVGLGALATYALRRRDA